MYSKGSSQESREEGPQGRQEGREEGRQGRQEGRQEGRPQEGR